MCKPFATAYNNSLFCLLPLMFIKVVDIYHLIYVNKINFFHVFIQWLSASILISNPWHKGILLNF